MKTPVPLVLLLALAPSIAPSQATDPHRWVRVLTTQGETVDLDTAAIARADRSTTVWLRWDFDRTGPELSAEYWVEQVEIDCQAPRARVLSAMRVRPSGSRGSVPSLG